MSARLLVLDKVSRIHGTGSNTVHALTKVSLEVHPGELVAVMGLAAGQALVVAGYGSLLGLVAGLLPGIVMGLAFTSDAGRDPLTSELVPGPGLVIVPWTPLLAVVVGVPLLAALVAAAAVRRTPLLTHRLT